MRWKRLLPTGSKSHRLWASDSTSILLPLVDGTGRTQLVVVPADGTDSRPIADGASGF